MARLPGDVMLAMERRVGEVLLEIGAENSLSQRETLIVDAALADPGLESLLPTGTSPGLAAADVMEMLLRSYNLELQRCAEEAVAKGSVTQADLTDGGRLLMRSAMTLPSMTKLMDTLGVCDPRRRKVNKLLKEASRRLEESARFVMSSTLETLQTYITHIRPLRVNAAHPMTLFRYDPQPMSSEGSIRALRLQSLSPTELAQRAATALAIRRMYTDTDTNRTRSRSDLETALRMIRLFLPRALAWYLLYLTSKLAPRRTPTPTPPTPDHDRDDHRDVCCPCLGWLLQLLLGRRGSGRPSSMLEGLRLPHLDASPELSKTGPLQGSDDDDVEATRSRLESASRAVAMDR